MPNWMTQTVSARLARTPCSTYEPLIWQSNSDRRGARNDAPQLFHLKVTSPGMASAPDSTLKTLNAIGHRQCHNLFQLLHNFLQPEVGRG